MSSEKMRIPDIKRLKIDHLPQNEALFKAFLSHCVPSSLQLFALNYNKTYLVKADDYLASLTSALQSTTKENYI
jgi:hypothetical protein